MSQYYLAPSLLSAPILNLQVAMRDLEAAGADWHHVDVMDGHFVPNLTFGLPLVRALAKEAKIPLDVHLMVTNPEQVAQEYVKAGAHRLSAHVEACQHPYRLISYLKSLGVKAGLAINPGTPVGDLEPLVEILDFILVMSVNPGFSGQSFIPSSMERVGQVAQMLRQKSLSSQCMISVDGGVSAGNIRELAGAGATGFVAGSAIFGATSVGDGVLQLRKALA